MEMYPAMWTVFGYACIGGILYLVYRAGRYSGLERGLRVKALTRLLLLVFFAVATALGRNERMDDAFQVQVDPEEMQLFLGMATLVFSTYLISYWTSLDDFGKAA